MKPAVKPTSKAVLEQLERVVSSPDFDSSARARQFLRYVVEAVVAGREGEICQHAIALDVFGRASDFDPTTDPIVRMQAGRVRRALEHYYLTVGALDPVRISLFKGTYVPVFEFQQWDSPSTETAFPSEPAPNQPSLWPKLLLIPFRNLTSDPQADNIAQGVVWELASELNNYRDLHLILASSEEDPRNRDAGAQFEVRGSVSNGHGELKISLQLLSGAPATLVWAHTYSAPPHGDDPPAFLMDLAHTLAATIASERGMMARHIAQEACRRPTAPVSAYEAILSYHRFAQSPSQETYRAARTGLHAAVKKYPECGCCWSFLARFCADDYALCISQDDRLIQDALSFARKGVELAPMDQRARGTLSYAYLLNDQIDEARLEAETALALNPNSLFVLEGIGYLLTLCGDWTRGPELSRKAVRLNPFHLPVVHSGLWLDALRREDFGEAYRQSLEFVPSEVFWFPLMQAVALSFLGRREEAAAQAAQIHKLKPEFVKRGRWFIQRYIKFDPLMDLVVNGLASAGLRI